MDREEWNARYDTEDLVWSAEPNQFLVSEVGDLAPATVVDLACGEGRNAIWLAEQGWHATGVDFSRTALDKGRQIAQRRGVTVEWIEADVSTWTPPEHGYDLVIAFYMQLKDPERSAAIGAATRAVRKGGTFLFVAHDLKNLTEGFGGPPNEAVLYTHDEVAKRAEDAGLTIEKAGTVLRTVETDDGERNAIDTLVRASRPNR